MVFESINIHSKNLIKSFLSKDSFLISDISFVNLFIWKHARDIRFCILHDCLIIETTYKNENPFIFFPIGENVHNKIKCLLDLKKYYEDKGLNLKLHSLESKNVKILKDIFNVDAILNRDRSDYIYLSQNLAKLSGRKYHKKKNHLNRFFDNYKGFEFIVLNSKNSVEVKKTLSIWHSLNDVYMSNFTSLQNEYKGICEVLDNYDDLDLYGGFLCFDSKIIAFSFGEIINSDLCIIHIEKADISYKGSYQAINYQLINNFFSDIKYVNREEDLGDEGLRKAKLSYYPDILLEKFEITI